MQSSIATSARAREVRESTEGSEKLKSVRDEDERSNDGQREQREDEDPLALTKLLHRIRWWILMRVLLALDPSREVHFADSDPKEDSMLRTEGTRAKSLQGVLRCY